MTTLEIPAARRPRRPARATVMGSAGATVAVAATAAGVYAALRGRRAAAPVTTAASVTVNRSPAECYAFWRRIENLPTFMLHLDSVDEVGAGMSHWRATAPFGRTIEWDAETTEDAPDQRISWRSVGDTPVANEGTVTFRPAPAGGTEIRAEITYRGVGALGRAVARYFGEEPRQQLDDDLRRLKQVIETGEVIRSDGALPGKRARSEFPQRPAQPATDEEVAQS